MKAKPKAKPKAKRKRVPAQEPFASKITDVERKKIILRAEGNDADDTDIGILLDDLKRARDKQVAALEQKATPVDEWGALGARFEVPDASESSAVLTASIIMPIFEKWAVTGARAKRQRKRAGIGRQSFMHEDDELAARHREWENARRTILELWAKTKTRAPSGRHLAGLICQNVPGSNVHTVRGWLRRRRLAK